MKRCHLNRPLYAPTGWGITEFEIACLIPPRVGCPYPYQAFPGEGIEADNGRIRMKDGENGYGFTARCGGVHMASPTFRIAWIGFFILQQGSCGYN